MGTEAERTRTDAKEERRVIGVKGNMELMAPV